MKLLERKQVTQGPVAERHRRWTYAGMGGEDGVQSGGRFCDGGHGRRGWCCAARVNKEDEQVRD